MSSVAGIRVIDTHVHVWDVTAPWMRWLDGRPLNWDVVRRNFSWSNLTCELDQASVAEIILVQACTDPRETVLLLELAQDKPRIRGVVGWASLMSPQATEADLALLQGKGSEKLVGIRNHHRWLPDDDILASPKVRDSVRLVHERGLSLDILLNDQSELPVVVELCEHVPDGRYIVDHMGRPILDSPDAFAPWAEAMRALSRHPGVFVKYSGWATGLGRTSATDVQRHIDFILELFGPERTMFASNWPVALVAGTYEETYRETLGAIGHLARTDLEQVMRGTALRCYLDGRE